MTVLTPASSLTPLKYVEMELRRLVINALSCEYRLLSDPPLDPVVNVDWMFPLTVPFALLALFVLLTWITLALNAAPNDAGAGLESTCKNSLQSFNSLTSF